MGLWEDFWGWLAPYYAGTPWIPSGQILPDHTFLSGTWVERAVQIGSFFISCLATLFPYITWIALGYFLWTLLKFVDGDPEPFFGFVEFSVNVLISLGTAASGIVSILAGLLALI